MNNELIRNIEYVESLTLEGRKYIKEYVQNLEQENTILKQNAEHNDKVLDEIRWENNQLKEQLEKKYEKIGTLTSEILYEENTKLQSVLKELRSWLEEYYDYSDCIKIKSVLKKLNELKGGKND